MSNLHAIGLLGALWIGGSFFMLGATWFVRNGNAGIIGGVIGGVPVPYEFRWRVLWNVQLPIVMNTGVFALLLGFIFVQFAEKIEDAAIGSLAWICAFVFFTFSALYLIMGPFVIATNARSLRQMAPR
jgi:hypothetical protein